MAGVGVLRASLRHWGQRVVLLLPTVLIFGCGHFSNIRVADPAERLNPEYLTVMSYNIRVGYGTKEPAVSVYELAKRPVSLALVVAAIRSVQPDVVGLQEVAGDWQARTLAKALNMNVAYVPHGLDTSGNWWGVAVLSKYRIVDAERVEISPGGRNRSPRSVVVCKTDVGGRSVAFVSVHRDHVDADDRAVKAILGVVANIETPVVVMGDLNLLPNDWRMGLLKERLVDTVQQVGNENARRVDQIGTFPSLGRIDYVLVDPRHFEVNDVGLIGSEHWDASDHLGYYAKIRLKR